MLTLLGVISSLMLMRQLQKYSINVDNDVRVLCGSFVKMALFFVGHIKHMMCCDYLCRRVCGDQHLL